jgi:hypothetical protein
MAKSFRLDLACWRYGPAIGSYEYNNELKH